MNHKLAIFLSISSDMSDIKLLTKVGMITLIFLSRCTAQLKIQKHLFLPEEYAGLKEFYNLLMDKMARQVVLKKKE